MSSEGWLVTGIADRRLLSGSLQLTRERREADGGLTDKALHSLDDGEIYNLRFGLDSR